MIGKDGASNNEALELPKVDSNFIFTALSKKATLVGLLLTGLKSI